MIDWLSGSSQSGIKYAFGDDGATFVDDAPETPAPLFAVRAFKTAIFGTPKPTEYKVKGTEVEQSTDQECDDNLNLERDSKSANLQNGGTPAEPEMPASKTIVIPDSSHATRLGNITSPTKGILLTPGTAATRRKTVSFSAKKELHNCQVSPSKSTGDPAVELGAERASIRDSEPGPERISKPSRKQSALTKTLIELSTKRSSPPAATTKTTDLSAHDQLSKENLKEKIVQSAEISEATVDFTVDLSQPRSRSGQHWKAEYDEYHRNSTREMKKIIQYGQNVKSYAVKKDFEATHLNEKLRKELAKVAKMETKVSKMAKQLKMVTAEGPQGDTEQARLVGELAQQTAMAVRYQKKAEHYRKALTRVPSHRGIGDQSFNEDESPPEENEDPHAPSDIAKLQGEMQSLREKATNAEQKAARLEEENKRLKRSLARVKGEMMNYDSKRQAKEERLKKREERQKNSKEQCEAELEKLRVKYHALLQGSYTFGKESQRGDAVVRSLSANEAEDKLARQQDTRKSVASSGYHKLDQARQPFRSPRKRHSQSSIFDIWSAKSPGNEPDHLSSNDRLKASENQINNHSINRPLHEIQPNIATSETCPITPDTKVPQAQPHPENLRPSTIIGTSPKPDIADDQQLLQSLPRQQLYPAVVDRSASLLGDRIGSRTSTMGTARTSSLSAERQAAAKARLAERKRSGEKKRREGSEGKVGSLR